MPALRSRDERVPQAATLAAVGGFLDAYTYLAHGGVFANAQTGNVVLFGVQAAAGHLDAAGRHLPPLAAFLAGMLTVEVLARSRARVPRPTRLVLAVEMVFFLVVGLLPGGAPDVVATVVVAYAATLQVGTFRSVRQVSYNTTFTTGNLRNLVSETVAWLHDHDAAARPRALALAAVVVAFGGGAVLGGLATRALDTRAVLLVVPVLAALLADIVLESRRLATVG